MAPKIEVSTDNDEGQGARDETSWHRARKLLLRFACIYFLWYAVPDFDAGRDTFLSRGMDRMAAWAGENVLGLGEINATFTASGDRMVHYVKLLLMVTGSLAGSLVWTLLDRRHAPRRRDRHLGEWLVVAVRYYLMLVMLGYGFAKVFPGQFPPLSLSRLLQPFGDASPMGVLWAAFGYSRAYAAFAGLGEIVGGLLLAWRRTTTLGALIIVAVMSNVVMMNFSYDVPVKIYSCHLLLMALVLVGLDWRRVFNVLVFDRPAPFVAHPPHFTNPTARNSALMVKVLAIGLILLLNLSRGVESERLYGSGGPMPPLYGLYDVETFVLDGETLPPLLTDPRRWQNVIFDRRREIGVRMMNDQIYKGAYYVEGANRLSIDRNAEDGMSFIHTRWTFERPAPGSLRLEGELDGAAVSIELKARDPEDFVLLSRGFHWVNEVPFNP